MSNLNFKVNKTAFYNALTTVSKSVSSNSPVPALSGVYIEASNDSLTLRGSDSDISIQMVLQNNEENHLGLNIIEEGSIVIDSRYLLDIVKKIDSDEISIEIIDGTLTKFEGHKAIFKINGFRPSDYPTIDFSKPPVELNLNVSTFNEMISQTAFAVSNKETRPVLTGVNLKEDGQNLIVTATDSYRLAKKTIPCVAEPFAITVPARCLSEAKSIFANDEELHISLSNKKIQFQNNNVILQSSLLDGGYPETDRLIPTEFTRTLVMNRSAFLSAIDRTSFIKTDNMAVIRLQLNNKDDITLSNKSQEIGESKEDLIAVSYDGEPLDISFSGSYAAEAARALSAENIKISFTGEMKPFIIQNDSENTDILQLVLPVRTYN